MTKSHAWLHALQQSPKLADVLHIFEAQQFRDEGIALSRAEDGNDEIARFSHDLLAAHGVFGRASHGLDAFGELRSVVQRDFDDGDALRDKFFEFLVADELHLGAYL